MDGALGNHRPKRTPQRLAGNAGAMGVGVGREPKKGETSLTLGSRVCYLLTESLETSVGNIQSTYR